MAKSKKGFGIGRFMSKKEKHVSPDWPETEDDFISPSSNAFINRPPPLDSRTEAELRQACALILQDLKPSGYDIEDTRMKSDILVDNEFKDPASIATAKAPRVKKLESDFKPVTDLTAYTDKKRESTSSNHPHSDTKSSALRLSSLTSLAKPPNNVGGGSSSNNQQLYNERTFSLNSQARTLSPFPQHRTQSLTSATNSALLPAEAPLAPAPTTVNVATPARYTVNQENPGKRGSETTNSSQQSAQTNQNGLASTGLTSAAITPSSTLPKVNERVGGQRRSDMYTNASEWMKEQVEKHMGSKDAFADSPSITDSFRPSTSTEAPASPTKAKGFFSSFRARSRSKASTDRPDSGLAKHARADSFQEDDEDAAEPPPPIPVNGHGSRGGLPRGIGTNFSRPSSSRGTTKNSMFRRDGNSSRVDMNSIKDKSDEPLANPRSRAAGIGARSDSLTSASVPHKIPRPGPERVSSSAHTDGTPTVPPVPVMSAARKPSVSDGRSAVSSPIVTAGASSSFAPAGSSSLNGHSQREQFLQQQLNDRPGTSASTASRRTLPHDTIPRRTSSRSQSMLQPPANIDNFARNKAVMQDRSMSMNAASGPSLQHIKIQQQARGMFTNGFEPRDKSEEPMEDDVVSLRDSDGPTSLYDLSVARAKSKNKERRGISKLLYRLGGGDMPSRRKIYVPPQYAYQTYPSQSAQEDDEYWDEEACAAPVIGFGRGW